MFHAPRAPHLRRLAGSLLLGAALVATGCGPSDPLDLPEDTPVVLVVIDTLRADHLSCYGYELETSPVLDALAERAYLFESNVTQSNATFPSLTSILTGLYPRTHRNYLPVQIDASTGKSPSMSLSERFAERGYATLAAMSHPMWDQIDPEAAMMRGWDEMSLIPSELDGDRRRQAARASYTNERLFALLDDHAANGGGKPLFLWAHYFDPHTDLPGLAYDPPPAVRDRFLRHHLERAGLGDLEDELTAMSSEQRVRWIRRELEGERAEAARLANGAALYDAEILSCDAGIGRLFDKLDAMGVLERALVVVMADHGENLHSRDDALAFGHHGLFQGVGHTPLIVRLPGQTEGHRVSALTQNIDVATTLLELLDLPANPPVEGRSLVPLLRDPTGSIHEQVFIESADNIQKAVKTDSIKLIDRGEERTPLVFRWREDGEERRNLLGELDPELVAELEGAIDDFRPVDVVRVRIQPAAEPFTVELDVYFEQCAVESVVGAPPDSLSDEGRRFRHVAEVTNEPVDLFLFPMRINTAIRWRIRHSGVVPPARIEDSVWIGGIPLRNTTAIPIWRAGDDPPTSLPRIEIGAADEAGELPIVVRRAGDEAVEVELRQHQERYAQTVELVENDGFEVLEERPVLHLAAKTGAIATARLRKSPAPAPLHPLFRIDGEWPRADEIALEGRALAAGELELRIPHPLDGRLTAALMTGLAEDALPPGGIAIWMEISGAEVEIDTTRLDQDVVDQLRTLGYVR